MYKFLCVVAASALALVNSPANATTVFASSTPGQYAFTVTKNGKYAISAIGGAGSLVIADPEVYGYEPYVFLGNPGMGAAGEFDLTAGEVLFISVGTGGQDSFVTSDAGTTLINAPGGNTSDIATPGPYWYPAGITGIPGQYIVDESPYLNDEQNNPQGFDGPWAVAGDAAPGFVDIYSLFPITAVPEPASWAMMLVGFGMVGATIRSRRQQHVRVKIRLS